MLARCQQYQHIKGVHQLSLDHSPQQLSCRFTWSSELGRWFSRRSPRRLWCVCRIKETNELTELWGHFGIFNESWMNNCNNITLLFVCSQKTAYESLFFAEKCWLEATSQLHNSYMIFGESFVYNLYAGNHPVSVVSKILFGAVKMLFWNALMVNMIRLVCAWYLNIKHVN